ncbi:hypothetical protein FACS1894219_06790 [Clostridia bacterium]|nr:hypothetical protein FACS1894219_06790 [Clostridia bacterium]
MVKTCCVTGHRDISAEKTEYVRQSLIREVGNAAADGYTHFITGFAEGADMLFAEVVAELKSRTDGITLEAAIPYRRCCERLKSNSLLLVCDDVKVVSEAYYGGCYAKRNAYMVRQSERVIAVYDGREKGGTYNTIKLARKKGKNLHVIYI